MAKNDLTCEAISDVIRGRIQSSNDAFYCNRNISEHIKPGELDLLVDEIAEKMATVFRSLVIDIDNDHNTRDTARRVAKMWIHETFKGRYYPKPKITSFPNISDYDQLYIAGPISVRGTCAHHLQGIVGKAYVGIYPGKNVIGLSKFNRLIDWITSRPSIQEEMTVEIANVIEQETEAAGVAVILRAEHMCVTHRGVKEHQSDMTTSVMRGVFLTNPDIKREFIALMGQMR